MSYYGNLLGGFHGIQQRFATDQQIPRVNEDLTGTGTVYFQ